MTEYTFELTGDFKSKLAEMADADNVIKLNPITATKDKFACYLMFLMAENAKQINTLTAMNTNLTETVNSHSAKITDLETAATAKDVEVQELKDELRNANLVIESQGRDIEHLKKRADQADQSSLDLERHSRSSNVRIGGIELSPKEDCKAKVTAVFEKLGLNNIDIENCHRVGEKKEGKVQYMIVKFVRRTERRVVMAKRKEFFDEGYPLYEDIPYKDLVIKKKYKAEIDTHYKNKDKCYFARGAWYVNDVKKYW